MNSSTTDRWRWHAWPAPVRRSAITVAILAVITAFLGLFDWNLARGLIGDVASSRMGREVRIDGSLELRLLSATPGFEIRQLRIRNPEWFATGTMADVGRIKGAIEIAPLFRGRLVFRELEIDRPILNLSRDRTGRANWWIRETRDESAPPASIPAMHDFRLRNATLRVDDAYRKLKFAGTVDAGEQRRTDSAQSFRLVGEGTLNGEPFTLAVSGSPLINMRVDQPYDFAATVSAGATRAGFRGSIARPFDLGRYAMTVDASGRNLADLYYLTGLPLPLTAAYRLRARVSRDGPEITMSDIVGRVGDSDLRGKAKVRTGEERPFLSADLVSHSLRLRDLGVAFGAEPANQPEVNADQTSAEATADLLLPDRDLHFERLAQIDANVNFRADAVQTVRVPLKEVMFRVKLNDGVMRLDPVVFTLPQGRLSGAMTLDARAPVPETEMDMRLSGVRLEQFKRKTEPNGPFSGTLLARARLKGSGHSVHDVASNADGAMTAVIPRGEVREAIAELTGINVLRGLGLLLRQSQETASIRCGVAEFKVDDGQAKAERIVLDTENVLVTGDGNLNLDNESLDLELTGKPKEPRLGRLRSPITVSGTLLKPAFGIKAEKAAVQGGIAATLGALINPIAAALAFVDPGLAKDADCAALLSQSGTPPASGR